MLAYDIIIKFYDDEGSFLGISFQVWSIIGSIFLPLLLFFIGLLFSRLSRRNSERKKTASLIKMLKYILDSQVNTVRKQGEDLREFARSVYNQKSIPNAVLSVRAIKMSELYSFDRQDTATLFIENVVGDKLTNFKTINGLFHDINYIEKNTDQILKVYNDFLNDLTLLRDKWNTANKNFHLVKNEIVRVNTDRVLINANRQAIATYNNTDHGMRDYYVTLVVPLRQILDERFRTIVTKSEIDVDLYNALNGIEHVYLEFEATKEKYFLFFNTFKRMMFNYIRRIESNKIKLENSKVKFYF